MSKEDKKKTSDNSLQSNKSTQPKESKPIAYAGPEQIVYEGSEVKLEGSCNKDSEDQQSNPNISYKWELEEAEDYTDTGNTMHVELDNKNIKNPSFKAPYINFDFNKGESNKPYATLTFKLVATDKTTGLSSDPSFVSIIVKMVQRALVLQGGGSLGAYELGVYRALCERLIEKDRSDGSRKNRPLFDIIAGTSIGALNAALIVHSVKKNMEKARQTKAKVQDIDTLAIWEKSVQHIADFWCDITIPFPWFSNDFFKNSWDLWSDLSKLWLENYEKYFRNYFPSLDLKDNYLNPLYLFFRPEIYTPLATGESARRYFSMASFPYNLPMRAITPSFRQPDTRFFLGVPAFFRFSNTPLAETAKQRYWDSDNEAIRTSFGDGEPRLLLVAVDILDATSAATFDSYLGETKYEDGRSKTHLYNKDSSSNSNKSEHVIAYDKGITMQHVKASMSPNAVLERSTLTDKENGETRYYWDGAYLSNTPLRELLHLHRYYWYDQKKKKEEEYAKLENKENKIQRNNGGKKTWHVPHLEVYIINLYPTVENREDPPKDPDTIQDRELDIRFHDKTKYDKKVAEMTTDYLILHGQIKNLARKHIGLFDKDKIKAFEDEFDEILNNTKTHSSKRRETEKRTFRDLVEGRFDVTRVVYIDRKDDPDTIFGKAADFSRETMISLEKEGYSDAQKVIKDEYPDLIVVEEGSYKIPQKSCLL
jgi:NTE family protein